MRKLFFSAALLSAGLLVEAQVTVSGQITNPKGNQIAVVLDNPNPVAEAQRFVAELDAEGKFSVEVPVEETSYARFAHGGETTAMYLQNGKDVAVSLDPQQFDESVAYTGEGAAPNNYLAGIYMLREKESGERYAWEQSLAPMEYMEKTKALMQKEMAELEKQKGKLPVAFVQEQKYDIMYGWGSKLMMYPQIKAYFSGGTKPELPEAYLNYKNELPLNNDKALSSTGYRNYLSQAVMIEASNAAVEGKDYYEAMLEQMNKVEGQAGNYIKANTYNDMLNQGKGHMISEGLKAFMADSNAKTYHEGLQATIDSWSSLEKGKPAPNFTLTSIEGETMSLADFKGKVVYLDFWASWCKPCLGEMPHSKTLKEKFADQKDVAFIYVSIDDNEDAWRKMVDKKQIEGIHLWSQGWGSEAPIAYNVKYIPRYVLVAKDGTIIDANTSRPSAEETAKQISQALALP